MFANRTDAGRRLADHLRRLTPERLTPAGVVVLGLPRGGVPVAFEVARALGAPLDVIVVRKLGVPFQPELAMGAIGEDGARVVDDDVVRHTRVTPAQFADVEAREREELQRRATRFRAECPRVPLDGRTALIVDDGIATGSTVRAACAVARAHGAARVVVATPVAPPRTVTELAEVADDVITVAQPQGFQAIGQFYDDFAQLSDDEVVALLRRARARGTNATETSEVTVDGGGVDLPGTLTVPAGATAVVLFAHGSGSSRHSPRNRYVAEVLQRGGLATLLFDLLTPHEERDRANVFAVELLAGRLAAATRWVRSRPAGNDARVGYFGASTGAAAALWAAADPATRVDAVVSRGGRPDLAGDRLPEVQAPTLLIVGGDDRAVLELNREARARMRCETDLVVVPGASHLFEEEGTLAAAAELARDWFTTRLR